MADLCPLERDRCRDRRQIPFLDSREEPESLEEGLGLWLKGEGDTKILGHRAELRFLTSGNTTVRCDLVEGALQDLDDLFLVDLLSARFREPELVAGRLR